MSRFRCPTCDYVYDEEHGDPREGWPAGTPFAAIDPNWCCPDCGVREQQDFVPVADAGPTPAPIEGTGPRETAEEGAS